MSYDIVDITRNATGWVKKTAIVMEGPIKDRHNTFIYFKQK